MLDFEIFIVTKNSFRRHSQVVLFIASAISDFEPFTPHHWRFLKTLSILYPNGNPAYHVNPTKHDNGCGVHDGNFFLLTLLLTSSPQAVAN